MASAAHQESSSGAQSNKNSQAPLRSSPRTPSFNPTSPTTALPSLATAGLKATSPSTSLKNFPAGSFQAPVLTGAGALADEKRMRATVSLNQKQEVSANPAYPSFSGLARSTDNEVSKPSDAPPPAVTIEAPGGAMTSSMPMVAEPMEIDEPESGPQQSDSVLHGRPDADASMGDSLRPPTEGDGRQGERSNKALTYPPRPTIDENRNDGARGMSLPGSHSNRSPSTKKHKCPNCATEFTRHHNLKSHLLTHSQEKPFPCEGCNQRFRRHHDLKRHQKLHTGERPHVCEKCKREFARGDALARHSKGPSGCAGRRGRGGDDDEDGEGDASFNGDESINGDHIDEHDTAEQGDFKRRKSEPHHNRKRSFQQALDPNLQPPRTPSTYPPVAPMVRPDIAHENNQFATPNHLSPRTGGTPGQPHPHFAAPGSYFAPQGGVTESPKPLSPGTADSRRLSVQGFAPPPRGRSPSLSTAFQQQHIRGSINSSHVGTPPILPAPIPSSTHGGPPPPQQQQLPSLAGMGVDSRSRQPTYPSPTSSTFPQHQLQQQQVRTPGLPPPPPPVVQPLSLHRPSGPSQPIPNGQGSASTTHSSGTASSHPRSSGGSMREILNSEPPLPTPAPALIPSEYGHDPGGAGGQQDPAWYRHFVIRTEGEKQMMREECQALGEENRGLREEVTGLRKMVEGFEGLVEGLKRELAAVAAREREREAGRDVKEMRA